MKTLRLVSVLLIAVTMLTGCDFFRSLIGKPTSKDIERMRIEAEAQAKKQKQLDSINAANALAEAQRLEELANSDQVNEADGRFLVILGSFKVDGNAEKMYSLLESKGYTPKKLKFKNGFDVVSAFASDNYREAYNEMQKMMEMEYCPDDIWVYDLHQGLHE